MNLTRRTFVGAAAAATTLIAKPAILFAAEPLVVGYVPGNAIHWIQSVCLEKGFYKEAGFDAKGATMQNSPQAMQSLISGGYQLATTQPEPLAAAWAHGAKNVAAIAAPMNAADWILSGKKGVNKLTDLKGQVIGVSSLRTSEVWLTTRLLEKAGLKKGEFNFIQSGVSPLKVAALLKGSIGAAVLFRPSADVAETQGLAGLAKYADLRAYPPILYCVNRDWAAKGNAGKRAAAAIKKGHEWMWDPNNKKESIAILAKYTKLDTKLLEPVYNDYFVKTALYSKDGAIHLDGFTNALDDMAEDGSVFTKAPPAKDMVLPANLGGMIAS
ncbi:MAG TPA: ABC transporter substrate-binding protein [Xanthobacteraceae bacterium]|jgi:ABC-type nitrate/sulfonate/bicarbonate transport system substrate-binding protein|nr:ABC transporter substrate-binding protein [Xanthobacteraceae bacterium]